MERRRSALLRRRGRPVPHLQRPEGRLHAEASTGLNGSVGSRTRVAFMTSDGRVERLLDGGWRFTDAIYNERWIARVRAKCIVSEKGCWVWQGNLQTKGYGGTAYRGSNVAAHRQMYKLVKGVELATEQFVCHTCDVRACCNPDHLFLGSAKDNNRDCGNKGRHHNGVKTHCKRGHPFTVENTYLKVTPTTVMRSCLTCEKIRASSPEYKAKALERQRRSRKRSTVSI